LLFDRAWGVSAGVRRALRDRHVHWGDGGARDWGDAERDGVAVNLPRRRGDTEEIESYMSLESKPKFEIAAGAETRSPLAHGVSAPGVYPSRARESLSQTPSLPRRPRVSAPIKRAGH